MGSWGHLFSVSLLLCVCATVRGHSLHAVGPCLVNTGKAAFHCSQKRLTDIPEDIWTNVTKLDLADNDLILSHPHTLKALQRFDKLVYLNLSANYLPLLARDMFSSLQSLEVLDLSRCQLTVIEAGALGALPRLQKLFLGHNKLPTSQSSALKNLRNVLSLLDLQGNPHDGPKGSRTGIRLEASQGHVHEHKHEGLEEQRIRGKNRRLLVEDPNDFTVSPTPVTTVNGTTPARVPSHNWQFLLGVLITAITLSIMVAVVAKCKLLHRYLASYRHSHFTNVDSESNYDPDVYEVGFAQRGGAAATISNGIADDDDEDEREGGEEDDDGFIEDNYIQPSERERAVRAAEQRQREEEDDLEDDLQDEMEFTIG